MGSKGIEHLPSDAQMLMSNPENELFFSVASLWEIVIKCGLGREDFKVDSRVLRRSLLDNDYHELPILSEHAVAISALPSIHKDPFDRLLVAQAIVEGITLLAADIQVAKYPGPIQRV
jgi:PIN domain nuclease of toxin-antitoxin system